jgi:hypothetical protein
LLKKNAKVNKSTPKTKKKRVQETLNCLQRKMNNTAHPATPKYGAAAAYQTLEQRENTGRKKAIAKKNCPLKCGCR